MTAPPTAPAQSADQPANQPAGLLDRADRAARLYAEAHAHLGRNDVAAAIPLLRRCRRLAPAHEGAARTLAAIAMKNGLGADGRRIMEEHFDRFPCWTARPERLGRMPALLKVRGFSGTRVIPWKGPDGTTGTRFRGGHFTTTYLLDNPQFPEHRFTIARQNILRPGTVPDHACLLNTIADPDLETETLCTLARYLEQHPKASVLNHPARVLDTTRDANWLRLREMPGVVFPETHRVRLARAGPDEIAATIARLGLDDGPVILRSAGTHTARTTALIRGRADLESYVSAPDRHTRTDGGTISGEHFLIRYVDWRWQGDYFRKLRLFAIDGALYPVVCHIDRVWNVHGGNRKEIMRGDESLMAEEKRFLADWRSYVGAANADALERLVDATGLEFCGIDFNIGEGGVLVYEMNPAMRHAFDHARNFPYKLPYDQAVTAAFTAMVHRRLGL